MHEPLPLSPEALAVVAPLLKSPAAPGAVVAFDADGTLWRGDVGEEMLRELVAQDRLPRYRGRRDLYEEYEAKVAADPATGYAFAAEVLEGWEEAVLLAWCRDFFQRQMAPQVFPFTGPLVRALAGMGYEVWIVSASPVWPVIPGAAWLDVPPARVIGVQLEVVGGILTGRSKRPVPCGEGKVELLEARRIRPVLAVGNGNLDEPMLAHAERALVVAPFGQDNGLVKAAARRGWPVQRG